MLYELSSKLINAFVLLQFDGSQVISHIEIGSMFPCLRISFSVCTLLSTLITLIICDCRTNFISFLFTDNIEKTTSRADIFIVARKTKPLSIQNLLIVLDNCDVHSLTEELEYNENYFATRV